MTCIFYTPGIMRSLSSIEGKISQLFSKYNDARRLKDQSGGGLTGAQKISFDTFLLKRFPYFDLLDPVMRDRHNSKPSYTNEDNELGETINLVDNDSDCIAIEDNSEANSDSESDNDSVVDTKRPPSVVECNVPFTQNDVSFGYSENQQELDMSMSNEQTCSSTSQANAGKAIARVNNDVVSVATAEQSTKQSSRRTSALPRRKKQKQNKSVSTPKLTPLDARNITKSPNIHGIGSPGRGKQNMTEMLQHETLRMLNNMKEQKAQKDSEMEQQLHKRCAKEKYHQRRLEMKEKEFNLRHTKKLMKIKEDIMDFNERMYDKRQQKKEANPSITDRELDMIYPYQELDNIGE